MIECERRLFLLHGLRTRHREVAGPGVYPSSESSLLEMRGSVDLGSAPLLTLLLRPPPEPRAVASSSAPPRLLTRASLEQVSVVPASGAFRAQWFSWVGLVYGGVLSSVFPSPCKSRQ